MDEISPDPIVQVTRGSNSFYAVSGASARWPSSQHRPVILGAAQGGIWTYDAGRRDVDAAHRRPDTLSIGAISVAPSNDESSTPAPARASSRATATSATAS